MELPAHLELTSVWREIRVELRRVAGESPYEIWLAALEVESWDGKALRLSAPAATRAWVANRFGPILQRCARSVAGPETTVAIIGTTAIAGSARGSDHTPLEVDAKTVRGEALNPKYSFEQFIIGKGNRLAHAASLAVAELPGQAYNPLFLHAPPGMGKTHLLHAIGNYLRAYGGGATVRYTTVEAFTNHFITALGTRSLDRFKRAYRDADALLIDDVQFLASKAKTEEEFFHTFNALYETGRQLVLTCDRLPHQLVAVEERLRERFQSGLVADIAAPDFATRLTILRKRAALDRIVLEDPAVLELIAERVTTNVRALEGALIRVVAYHSLIRRPVDLDLARTVLDSMSPEIQDGLDSAPMILAIQAAVAAYYELSVDELLSASRRARVAWPRQIAVYLAREHTDSSLQAVGEAFGGRNHATVLYACKRVSERLARESATRAEVGELVRTLSRRRDDRGR
ncbi:MAG: chromosomal replication initiator protein DnaA [Solirubrobacteraceae bacterium]